MKLTKKTISSETINTAEEYVSVKHYSRHTAVNIHIKLSVCVTELKCDKSQKNKLLTQTKTQRMRNRLQYFHILSVHIINK